MEKLRLQKLGKHHLKRQSHDYVLYFFFKKNSFEDTDGGLLLLHDGALTEHRLSNVPSMWGF